MIMYTKCRNQELLPVTSASFSLMSRGKFRVPVVIPTGEGRKSMVCKAFARKRNSIEEEVGLQSCSGSVQMVWDYQSYHVQIVLAEPGEGTSGLLCQHTDQSFVLVWKTALVFCHPTGIYLLVYQLFMEIRVSLATQITHNMHVCIHWLRETHIHTYICMHACTCMHTCACAYTHKHMHTRVHASSSLWGQNAEKGQIFPLSF